MNQNVGERQLLETLQRLTRDANTVFQGIRTSLEDGVSFEQIEVMFGHDLKERLITSLEIVELIRVQGYSNTALEAAIEYNEVCEKACELVLEPA